jgi:hypothetical protein
LLHIDAIISSLVLDFFPNENTDLLILTPLTSSYSAYFSPGSPTKEKSISPKK